MSNDQARELIAVLRQIDRSLQELVKTTSAAFTKWDRARPGPEDVGTSFGLNNSAHRADKGARSRTYPNLAGPSVITRWLSPLSLTPDVQDRPLGILRRR
jgi:hypothetical protein